MSRVVLVTGVSRDLGARFARSLAGEGDVEVIGLDVTPPRHDLGGAEYVRADLRSPLVARVVAQREVDTVVHLGLVDTGGAAGAKETNVLGSMQLLAACQAESVRKVVLHSSSVVYGSDPLDPARYTEDMVARHAPSTGFGREVLEVEGYLRGLGQRRPDLVCTVLRPAHLLGAGVDTHLTRWLSRPVVPRPLGFDARLQFLHPADAVAALEAATRHDLPGVFNVGATDVVSLGQVLRTLGRPELALPASPRPWLLRLSRRMGLLDLTPDELRGVTWGRVLDVSRFIEASGVEPYYSSRRALEEFAAMSTPGLLSASRIDSAMTAAARFFSGPQEGPRG